jgi:hypothetical protein
VRPIPLSDDEMDAVYRACAPIAPNRRGSFLQALAAELNGKPIGEGSVYRAIVAVQRAYFDPPLSTAEIGKPSQPRMHHGKYA